jgi:hypothetical protein
MNNPSIPGSVAGITSRLLSSRGSVEIMESFEDGDMSEYQTQESNVTATVDTGGTVIDGERSLTLDFSGAGQYMATSNSLENVPRPGTISYIPFVLEETTPFGQITFSFGSPTNPLTNPSGYLGSVSLNSGEIIIRTADGNKENTSILNQAPQPKVQYAIEIDWKEGEPTIRLLGPEGLIAGEVSLVDNQYSGDYIGFIVIADEPGQISIDYMIRSDEYIWNDSDYKSPPSYTTQTITSFEDDSWVGGGNGEGTATSIEPPDFDAYNGANVAEFVYPGVVTSAERTINGATLGKYDKVRLAFRGEDYSGGISTAIKISGGGQYIKAQYNADDLRFELRDSEGNESLEVGGIGYSTFNNNWFVFEIEPPYFDGGYTKATLTNTADGTVYGPGRIPSPVFSKDEVRIMLEKVGSQGETTMYFDALEKDVPEQ